MVHAIALVAAMAPGALHAEFVSLFRAMDQEWVLPTGELKTYRYRLFIPDGAGPTKKVPLLIWLHGFGEAGDDNTESLAWLESLVLRPPWERHRYPFAVLVVQCPKDNALWFRKFRDRSNGEDMIDLVDAILDRTLIDFPIDAERISASGISAGGDGTWELATRHPERFAAIAPLASGGGDNHRIARLKDVPVWAFHSIHDEWAAIGPVRETVRTLKSEGGTVCLTELEAPGHDCWTSAFEDYYLLDWLLAQRKGSVVIEPGSIPMMKRAQHALKGWEWYQLLGQALFVVVALGGMIVVYMMTKGRVWSAVDQYLR